MLKAAWGGITNAIQSITESSNLNFVEELPESRIEHLHLLVRQAESKEEIVALEKEIDFLQTPAQACMRNIDRMARESMATQLKCSQNRNAGEEGGILSMARTALKSWRQISGAELTFVPTQQSQSKQERSRDQPQTANVSQLGFLECMEKLHVSLGSSPPDLFVASQCALHMIELVGMGEGGGDEMVTIEVADSCSRKVTAVAVDRIDMHCKACVGANRQMWEKNWRLAMAIVEVCITLGTADEACGALSKLPQPLHLTPEEANVGGCDGIDAEMSLYKERIEEIEEMLPNSSSKGGLSLKRSILGWAVSCITRVLADWTATGEVEALLEGGGGKSEVGRVLQAASTLEEKCEELGVEFDPSGELTNLITPFFEAWDALEES